MTRRNRTIGIVVGVILILTLIGGGFWRSFTRKAIPKTKGTLQVDGLNAPVEIYRDSYGVAHIYAETTEDLFFAEGYVHAQERFWQMEMQRRTGAARLSEVFGETTLPVDRFLRSFRFYELAEAAYDRADAESKLAMDSYAAGVNAYISDRKPSELGLEFAILGLQGNTWEIEEWSPVDSLVWGEMMIYDQGDVLGGELNNLEQIRAVGLDMAADLHPAYRDDRPVIVPDEELDYVVGPNEAVYQGYSEDELSYLNEIIDIVADNPVPAELAVLGLGMSGGSNSYSISGELTESGMPILVNDPHMGVNMPAIWYEIGMHCVEKNEGCGYDLRGFSLVGIPGILIGHNDRIAWGMTNATFDAEDVFIERINPENPNQYEVNGEWVEMEIVYEEIIVRGRDEPYMLEVRHTRNGLVATDVIDRDGSSFSQGDEGVELYALAFQWTALEPVDTIQAVIRLNRAQNFEQFREALSYFDAGKQTFVYADVDGNIGFQYTGKIPVRAKGNGLIPVPGWNDDYQWLGFIPYEELPYAYNPAQGYIATANHAPARPSLYPYHLNTDFDAGQRAQRANDMIQEMAGSITIDDMRAIQRDTTSLSAQEIIPYIEDLSISDAAIADSRDRIVGWDTRFQMDSMESAVYAYFWRALVRETFGDQLPADLMPNGKSQTSDTIYWLLQDPDNAWWDDVTTPQVEDRDDMLLRALERGVADGVAESGEDLDAWLWGDIHQVSFDNATLGQSGIGVIENIFNRSDIAVHGSESVIPKTCWLVGNDDFHVTCIPALREIIDLDDLSNSLMVISVGQSGHPMSRHYDDMIDMWRNFEYHPSNWSRVMVEDDSRELLTLTP